MKPLEFSLATATVPVTIRTGDGKMLTLQLKEMTAAARDSYLDMLGDRMRIGSDGRPCGIKKFEGMQADLVSLCLSHTDGRMVDKGELQKWPASVLADLFQAAQELNHLGEAEKTPAKND